MTTMAETMRATTEKTNKSVSASRTLSFPGRRRQRAAGERIGGLYEEHGRMVYGVCRLVLRDPVEAEDAAQQTFLSAYRGLLAGQEPREPAAWLGTIARNECRTRLRSRRTEPLTLVSAASPDDTQRAASQRAEIEALCTALSQLPQQQRDAIVLREFYGLSYAEVAAALGLTGAAVESLIFRSRRRLQDQLRPMRVALGVLTLPLTLRDSLAETLPGFGAAGAVGGGTGAALLAKAASAPVAAKVAAVALTLGTAGTVAGLETHSTRPLAPPPAAAAKRTAPVSASRPALVVATRVRVATSEHAPVHERSGRAAGALQRQRRGRDDSGEGEGRSQGKGDGVAEQTHEQGGEEADHGDETTVETQAPTRPQSEGAGSSGPGGGSGEGDSRGSGGGSGDSGKGGGGDDRVIGSGDGGSGSG
jgi:RNA polymerase sigma-70 factor (ECF subfamily)